MWLVERASGINIVKKAGWDRGLSTAGARNVPGDLGSEEAAGRNPDRAARSERRWDEGGTNESWDKQRMSSMQPCPGVCACGMRRCGLGGSNDDDDFAASAPASTPARPRSRLRCGPHLRPTAHVLGPAPLSSPRRRCVGSRSSLHLPPHRMS